MDFRQGGTKLIGQLCNNRFADYYQGRNDSRCWLEIFVFEFTKSSLITIYNNNSTVSFSVDKHSKLGVKSNAKTKL